MLINQPKRPQKMFYIHQYIVNVCDYLPVDSVFEITFNKSKKSVIEENAFQGGGEISPPLGGLRVKIMFLLC